MHAYKGLVQYWGRGLEARLLIGYMSATAWGRGLEDRQLNKYLTVLGEGWGG